jgi:hypothetical protein
MNLDALIDRWSVSGDAERTNKDSFLNELCDVLGVERPYPKTRPGEVPGGRGAKRFVRAALRRGYGQWLP